MPIGEHYRREYCVRLSKFLSKFSRSNNKENPYSDTDNYLDKQSRGFNEEF